MATRSHLILCFSLLGSAACGSLSEDLTDTNDVPTGKVQSEEKIDAENDPNRFRLDLVRSYDDLPSSGTSLRKPFPSNWWPMSQGGVARAWNGNELGPAQKYDQLVTPDRIRDVQLTLAKKNWKDEPVNQEAQPETFHVGPAAEWELKNHGRYGETDPESWWGHCNGWASYVLNEDEPIRPVLVRYDAATRRVTECASGDAGCVLFQLGDINALGAELYWQDGARMAGRRCEQADSEFNFDPSGRINSVECRDGNAGTFHIVVTNMIGRLERPFIVDLTADRQVWNYPVYSYELLENREVTLQEALQLIGAPAGTTTWTYNPDARRFIRVRMRASIVEDAIPPSTRPAGDQLARYTTLENYEYLLELDQAGTITGGEWTGDSKRRHPDFVWYSYSNSAYSSSSDDLYDGDNDALRYSIWKQILTLAQTRQQPPPSGNVVRREATPNLAIPDANATGVSSSVEVEEAFDASRVSVSVDITHSYRGDLRVVLRHGDREQVLHDQSGGSLDNLNLAVDATTFAGTSARGTWTLVVSDVAKTDTGSLVRWSIDLTRATTGGGGGGGTPTPRTYDLRPALAIPDNNTTGIRSTINVPDSFNAARVSVTVDITHTYRGDLLVTLVKGDRSFVLSDRAGGNAADLRQTFDVPSFAGLAAQGAWELRVVDTAAQDTGTLNRWTLNLTPAGSSSGGGTGGGTGTVTREVSAAPNASIPDNTPAGITSTINVTDSIRISDLRVAIDIAHPYVGDLVVTLEKDGQSQVLHNKEGGSADDIRRTFETRAFASSNARGTWTLRVVDAAASDVGRLERWRLIINGTPQ
jgi:subtilisin-like proprotein convertase family protein